jgi:hypothetical protein
VSIACDIFLLPLHGNQGRGLGRGASDIERQLALDSTLPHSPALSPDYRREGVEISHREPWGNQ